MTMSYVVDFDPTLVNYFGYTISKIVSIDLGLILSLNDPSDGAGGDFLDRSKLAEKPICSSNLMTAPLWGVRFEYIWQLTPSRCLTRAGISNFDMSSLYMDFRVTLFSGT